MQKKLILSLLFLLAIILSMFFYIFFTLTNFVNNFSEKLFINYHYRNIPIFLLENLKKENKDYYTYFLLGRIYFVKGHLEKSINAYTKSIDLKNDFAKSYYGRGLSYGFYDDKYLRHSESDFKKYLELEDRNAYGLWAGYNDLAWVYFLTGEFHQSENTARQGLEISKNNPWLLNMLATAQIEQNNCKDAVANLLQAQNFAEKLTPTQFGEAYSGDNKIWWASGLEQMQETIEHNLQICEKKLK